MKEQDWFCEKCNRHGTALIGKHDSMITVVQTIFAQHSLDNPSCAFDMHRVRVRNPEMMSVQAWERMNGGMDA